MRNTTEVCPVFRKCGGCQHIGEPYDRQLRRKQEYVEKLLNPFGPVRPVIGMEDPLYYRNKVHAAFGQKKDGTIVCGTYQEGTHRIIPAENCLLEDRRCAAIIRDIRDLAQSFRLPVYNEDTGRGVLRHVLVRVGHDSGQILVVLVVGTSQFPSRRNFVNALRRMHPEITSVVQNINDRKTSMILGTKESVLYGKGYIEDRLCGKIFRISPASFYQVNSVQTEILYRKAIELADLNGKETVIDAYCGIGTIGIICAGKTAHVTGIENNKDAVRDARKNAQRNQTANIHFFEADAGEYLTAMADRGEQADVLMMDPPRSGSSREFLRSAVRMQPDRIVYISCEPKTLARDLVYLTGSGYRMKEAWPVDQFVFTDHIETVVLLSHDK